VLLGQEPLYLGLPVLEDLEPLGEGSALLFLALALVLEGSGPGLQV
jgi:hypothetical protein